MSIAHTFDVMLSHHQNLLSLVICKIVRYCKTLKGTCKSFSILFRSREDVRVVNGMLTRASTC